MNYMGDSTWWNNRFKNRALNQMKPELCLQEDARTFSPHLKILDVACGDGRNALYLAALGHEVSAVDFSEEALKRLHYFASQENLHLSTFTADLSTNFFQVLKGLSFDVIIINHYRLNHKNYGKLITFLNPGGILWVNGFQEVPLDNPDIKPSDLILDSDFTTLKSLCELTDQKAYTLNDRQFVRYIWTKPMV